MIEESYNWLLNEPGPLMIKRALELYNVIELSGSKNNPIIINWAKEVGGKVEDVYKADEIPWCGLFMAVVAKRAAKLVVKDPLWALNWSTFGKQVDIPMLGDVLVFVRNTPSGRKAGHVGLYVGEDNTHYHVLGGNQSDKVCIVRIDKKRLYVARRANYRKQPNNIRIIKLANKGKVSNNES